MRAQSAPSRSFLTAILAVPLVTSIAVACASTLIPTASEQVNEADAGITPATTTTTAQPASPIVTHTAPPGMTELPPSAAPADMPTPSPTATRETQDTTADAEHGAALFNNLGCAGCHGKQGEGGIGPTIAQTELALARVIRQYRTPYQNMPRFGPGRVSEADIADIYAFLHTLPPPETRVPSVLADVTPEAGIGTVRGTIRYSETDKPAVDEQIYILPASQNPDSSLAFSYLPHLPADTTDSQGRFEIADVEAQLYAVFYSRQEAPVRDGEGNIVLVNVLPGKTAEVEGFMPAP